MSTGTVAFDPAPYDAWYGTAVGHLTHRLEQDAVLAMAGASPGRAADLACGTGHYALMLAASGREVVGVDRAPAMLRAARAKVIADRRRPRFVCADTAALPLRSGAVDLVTVVLGLEFTRDPGAVLRESHRILRPGGTLVVGILRAAGAWTLWRRLKRLFVPSVWRGARFLSERRLHRLLMTNGFAPLACRRAVHYLPVIHSGRLLAGWEAVASRLFPGVAAFAAVRAEARCGSSRSATALALSTPGPVSGSATSVASVGPGRRG